MLKGLSAFSPILKAVVGAVGVMIASSFRKALSKSCLIRVRAFNPFK